MLQPTRNTAQSAHTRPGAEANEFAEIRGLKTAPVQAVLQEAR